MCIINGMSQLLKTVNKIFVRICSILFISLMNNFGLFLSQICHCLFETKTETEILKSRILRAEGCNKIRDYLGHLGVKICRNISISRQIATESI